MPLIQMKLAQVLSNDRTVFGYNRLSHSVQHVAAMMSASPNPEVMALLEEPEYIHMRRWDALSLNPAAIHILEAHQDRIDYDQLCKNHRAMRLVQDMDNFTDRQLCFLAQNQSKWAMEMMDPYLESLHGTTKIALIHNLSSNPFATPLLEKYPEYLNITSACANPKAIHLIRPHLQDPIINWLFLSRNEGAIDILRANPEKINWRCAAFNKNLMQLWDEFKDKIVQEREGYFWQHPEMFVPLVDYQAIRDRHVVVHGQSVYFSDVLKELMALYYHPSRMNPETFDIDGTKSVFSGSKCT